MPSKIKRDMLLTHLLAVRDLLSAIQNKTFGEAWLDDGYHDGTKIIYNRMKQKINNWNKKGLLTAINDLPSNVETTEEWLNKNPELEKELLSHFQIAKKQYKEEFGYDLVQVASGWYGTQKSSGKQEIEGNSATDEAIISFIKKRSRGDTSCFTALGHLSEGIAQFVLAQSDYLMDKVALLDDGLGSAAPDQRTTVHNARRYHYSDGVAHKNRCLHNLVDITGLCKKAGYITEDWDVYHQSLDDRIEHLKTLAQNKLVPPHIVLTLLLNLKGGFRFDYESNIEGLDGIINAVFDRIELESMGENPALASILPIFFEQFSAMFRRKEAYEYFLYLPHLKEAGVDWECILPGGASTSHTQAAIALLNWKDLPNFYLQHHETWFNPEILGELIMVAISSTNEQNKSQRMNLTLENLLKWVEGIGSDSKTKETEDSKKKREAVFPAYIKTTQNKNILTTLANAAPGNYNDHENLISNAKFVLASRPDLRETLFQRKTVSNPFYEDLFESGFGFIDNNQSSSPVTQHLDDFARNIGRYVSSLFDDYSLHGGDNGPQNVLKGVQKQLRLGKEGDNLLEKMLGCYKKGTLSQTLMA